MWQSVAMRPWSLEPFCEIMFLSSNSFKKSCVFCFSSWTSFVISILKAVGSTEKLSVLYFFSYLFYHRTPLLLHVHLHTMCHLYVLEVIFQGTLFGNAAIYSAATFHLSLIGRENYFEKYKIFRNMYDLISVTFSLIRELNLASKNILDCMSWLFLCP